VLSSRNQNRGQHLHAASLGYPKCQIISQDLKDQVEDAKIVSRFCSTCLPLCVGNAQHWKKDFPSHVEGQMVEFQGTSASLTSPRADENWHSARLLRLPAGEKCHCLPPVLHHAQLADARRHAPSEPARRRIVSHVSKLQ
jgi:hypothetical protein